MAVNATGTHPSTYREMAALHPTYAALAVACPTYRDMAAAPGVPSMTGA